MEIKVKAHNVVDGPLFREAYELYVDAFRPLRKVAVQNHEMSFNDFSDVMRSIAIEKHLVYVNEELAGISVVTNNLYAWPLISPEYFEHNYPQDYLRQGIWYVGFVCVAERFQKSGAFQEMLGSMTAGRREDLFFMDFCTSNIDRKIVLLCTRALKHIDDRVKMSLEDRQEFWMVEWADNVPGIKE